MLATLLERVDDVVGPQRAGVVREFARAALRRVPPEQLAAADPDETVRQILSAFRFVDERAPGELAIRIFTPEVALDGWSDPGTVVEVNVEDRPFLLLTAREELRSRNLAVVRTLHPILGVERGEGGRLVRIVPARGAGQREAFLHFELDATIDPGQERALEAALRDVLGDALGATRDHDAMRRRVADVAQVVRAVATARYDANEVEETANLLEWLLDRNFVLLGWREYEVVDVHGEPSVRAAPGSGLGILSDHRTSTYAEPVPLSEMDADLLRRLLEGPLLTVSRTNRLSTVRRRVPMTYIGVKQVSPDGEVVGEYRLLGLFTRKAFAVAAADTPVLRRKLDQILEREDVVPGSHDEGTLVGLFQALPKDELFETDRDTLHRHLVDLLRAEENRETRVLVRADPLTRTVSILVAVPRDRYSPALRQQLQALFMQRFAGDRVDVDVSLGDRAEVVARFSVHTRATDLPSVRPEELEQEVRDLARSWLDEIETELVRRQGEGQGRRLHRDYAAPMPLAYREATPVGIAVEDIEELARLGEDGLRVRFHEDPHEPALSRFKAYRAGAPLELSGFLPILESLGLTVVEEVPHQLEGHDPPLFVHDFGVRDQRGLPIDIERDGARVAAASLASHRGAVEVDSMNRLVLHAGLEARDVTVLRAYRRYRRQVGTAYSPEYVNDALVENADAARALVDLFAARFDPDLVTADIEAARQRVVAACDAIERLDHDRILRAFLVLIDATLRTTHYQTARSPSALLDQEAAAGTGTPYLALKIDSASVPGMPKPVPYREIFVFSPEVEGIHLRGGPVARGGLRWSDRKDDVRTEVFGLMKAQLLKNALIVPTGAKGGFVPKRLPADPSRQAEEVRRQYVTFLRGLLDLTDNVVDGEVVTPPRVRRYDGDDPYLVVAADRGTAMFSDLANEIAEAHGFWLGDAFASGGSRGYNHKELGITARGAWVAVRRHFRELDVDVQTDPIRVVAIGDMSGDVCGNGLLQSRAVKLVAAFDHRDIFLDPDPDPAASFAERDRMFHLPASSWQDYDRTLLSPGGGVWSRALKRIELSDEARDMLRIPDEHLTPPELIQAILRAPVDLIFAGGIGTFVKATTETQDDIADRANDELRVDATEVRARVVGEGANLAFTQRARIQYARRGGRINIDAIDNAAGVDISDHEVNVKILLGTAEAVGLIDRLERNRLLADVADDVVAHVLRDCDLQTWRLGQEALESPKVMDAYETLLRQLEARDVVDRDVDVLPLTEEMEERQAAGAGLTRPELATLMGLVKRELATVVLASELPDRAAFRPVLDGYFPAPLVERFADLVDVHRLRRELTATIVSNDLVNRVGLTFVARLRTETGAAPAAVAAAYWAAREVSGADRLWRAVEALDDVLVASQQLEAKRQVDELVENLARAYLVTTSHPDVASIVASDRPTFELLETDLLRLGTNAQRTGRLERARRLIDDLVDPDLAERLACLRDLAMAPDIAAASRSIRGQRSVAAVADAFLRIDEALAIDRLSRSLASFEPADRWQRWQRGGLLADLRVLRRAATIQALTEEPDLAEPDAVSRYFERRAPLLGRALDLVRDLEGEEPLRLDAVAVAERALRAAHELSAR